MAATKITVRLINLLNDPLNKQLDECFIKRDKFIAHLIESQLSDLSRALGERKLSPKAKRYISGQLKRAGTKLVNVQVDQALSERLNAIVEKHNLVRDAVINRIVFFAIAGSKIYERFDVMQTIEQVINNSPYMLTLPISPIKTITELLEDPLFFVKEAFEIRYAESIYTYDFSYIKINDIDTNCFSCYLDDVAVPDTKAFKDMQSELDQFLADLLQNEPEVPNA